MARSSSRATSRSYGIGQRATLPGATYSPVKLTSLVGPLTQTTLPEVLIHDRRLFHPDKPVRETRVISRNSRQQRFALSPALRYLWSDPSRKLAVCARRKIRREVLHALKKAGGNSGRAKKRYTAYSKVKC